MRSRSRSVRRSGGSRTPPRRARCYPGCARRAGSPQPPAMRCRGQDGELRNAAGDGGIAQHSARFSPGAICLSSSSHFPLMPNSNRVNPVALPPGRARLATKPAPTGSLTFTNTIRHLARRLQQRRQRRVSGGHDGLRCQRDQLGRAPAQKFVVVRDRRGARSRCCAPDPSQLLQTLTKGCHASLPFRIVRGSRGEHPDAPHRSGCCARAASGHTAAAPPSSVMNSRRLIRSPRRRAVADRTAPRGQAPWRS